MDHFVPEFLASVADFGNLSLQWDNKQHQGVKIW